MTKLKIEEIKKKHFFTGFDHISAFDFEN